MVDPPVDVEPPVVVDPPVVVEPPVGVVPPVVVDPPTRFKCISVWVNNIHTIAKTAWQRRGNATYQNMYSTLEGS